MPAAPLPWGAARCNAGPQKAKAMALADVAYTHPAMQLEDVKQALRSLGPAGLRRLANQRLSTVVLQESRRAKRRVSELRSRYPSAASRELAQHLIEQKKQAAALVGGISGAFGVAGIPADLVAMAVLEIQLLVDIATAYDVRLEFARSREELLDVLGTAPLLSQGLGEGREMRGVGDVQFHHVGDR